MDSYDGYGSPGRSRDGETYSARVPVDSYRRRSPGKDYKSITVILFDSGWDIADLPQLPHRIDVVPGVVAPALLR
jgi:hypothetical protein